MTPEGGEEEERKLWVKSWGIPPCIISFSTGYGD